MHKNNYRLFRIYGYPGFGLVLYLIQVLINPYERTLNSWHFYSLQDFILEFSFSVAYAALLFESGIQLTALLNKWLPWESQTKRRFGTQLLIQIAIVYIMVNVFFRFHFPDYYEYDETTIRQIFTIGVIFSLLITAVFAAEHFFYQWNDARLKSMEMEQHTIQAQLDALKLQLDPHFLFNNLSIVTALVEDQPAVAISYIGKLSSIYRYMLTNRTQNVIPLKEELDFIKSYLYLYQIRYGNGIDVQIEEMKDDTQSCLPPLTLQLLIENAIKHNFFSTESPLTIHIFFPQGKFMVVENNRMPGINPVFSTSTGLKNIEERYRLLNEAAPVIISNEGYFRVEVPLIG